MKVSLPRQGIPFRVLWSWCGFPLIISFGSHSPCDQSGEGRGAVETPKVGPEGRIRVCLFSGERAEVRDLPTVICE